MSVDRALVREDVKAMREYGWSNRAARMERLLAELETVEAALRRIIADADAPTLDGLLTPGAERQARQALRLPT